MRDGHGRVQLFTVSPLGGEPVQITRDPWAIASAFTWSPDGNRIAYAADGSVMTVAVPSWNDDLSSPGTILTTSCPADWYSLASARSVVLNPPDVGE